MRWYELNNLLIVQGWQSLNGLLCWWIAEFSIFSWKTHMNFHGNVSFSLAHLRMGHSKRPYMTADIFCPVNWSSQFFQRKIIRKFKCYEVNITIMIYSWKLCDKSISISCIYQQVGFWKVFGVHFLNDVYGFFDQFTNIINVEKVQQQSANIFFFSSDLSHIQLLSPGNID